MTTTSSDVNTTGNREHSAPDTETRSECFEINRHRDGAIFRVRYREAVSYTHLTLPTTPYV